MTQTYSKEQPVDKAFTSLAAIIQSPAFKEALEETAKACAHVKQERQLFVEICKQYWKQIPVVEAILECTIAATDQPHRSKTKFDLLINDTTVQDITVQGKFHYDFDILEDIYRDREALSLMCVDLDGAYKSVTFDLVTDILHPSKRPDIFIWIVCCRDFRETKVSTEFSERLVAFPKRSNKVGRTIRDWPDHLEKVDKGAREFLGSCAVSTGELRMVRHDTSGYFPSTYFFYLCKLPPLETRSLLSKTDCERG